MPGSHMSRIYRTGEEGAWTGIFSNFLLFAFKLAAGIFGRSQAMIADAFHTGSDAFTSICVLAGFKLSQKPADEHHPFGHGRAEAIAAKIVSIILILVGLRIAYGAALMLIKGVTGSPGNIAVIAAVVSIILKELTYRRVIKTSRDIKSVSLRADAYHHRSDVMSSFAALAGIAGAKAGYQYMDPLAGIIVSGFIISSGFEAFHQAYDELMDAAPPKEFRDRVGKAAAGIPEVGNVSEILVRKSGLEYYIEMTIEVDKDMTVEKAHLVTIKAQKAVSEKFSQIRGVMVHVEPGHCDQHEQQEVNS